MFRFMRYLPMSYDVLCENVLDPSHVSLADIGWSAVPGPCCFMLKNISTSAFAAHVL